VTNELDRLLTINDLSEMLGVPVDTVYGWRHRGLRPRQAAGSVARSVPRGYRRSSA
jgi:hypothetical protein